MKRLLSVIACLAAGFAALADLPDIAGIETILTGNDSPRKTELLGELEKTWLDPGWGEPDSEKNRRLASLCIAEVNAFQWETYAAMTPEQLQALTENAAFKKTLPFLVLLTLEKLDGNPTATAFFAALAGKGKTDRRAEAILRISANCERIYRRQREGNMVSEVMRRNWPELKKTVFGIMETGSWQHNFVDLNVLFALGNNPEKMAKLKEDGNARERILREIERQFPPSSEHDADWNGMAVRTFTELYANLATPDRALAWLKRTRLPEPLSDQNRWSVSRKIAFLESEERCEEWIQKSRAKDLVLVTARLEKTTLEVRIENCSPTPVLIFRNGQPLSELHIAVREQGNGAPARMTKLGAKESEPYSGSAVLFGPIAPGTSHEWKIDLTKYFVLETGKSYDIEISGYYSLPKKTEECFRLEKLPLKL